jgi:hypothetical protein
VIVSIDRTAGVARNKRRPMATPNEASAPRWISSPAVRFLKRASSFQTNSTRSPRRDSGESPSLRDKANLSSARAEGLTAASSSHHEGHAAWMAWSLSPASLSSLMSALESRSTLSSRPSWGPRSVQNFVECRSGTQWLTARCRAASKANSSPRSPPAPAVSPAAGASLCAALVGGGLRFSQASASAKISLSGSSFAISLPHEPRAPAACPSGRLGGNPPWASGLDNKTRPQEARPGLEVGLSLVVTEPISARAVRGSQAAFPPHKRPSRMKPRPATGLTHSRRKPAEAGPRFLRPARVIQVAFQPQRSTRCTSIAACGM